MLSGCSKPTVNLPNGYALHQQEGAMIYLIDKQGKRVIDKPVTQFFVCGEHMYGWIDKGENGFFYLNTRTGESDEYKRWADLDAKTDKLQLPRLTMKDSLTYLDVISGYKNQTW